ncbi:TonB-dependent receptor [Pseudomonas syringae pv. actinidiae]|nr:TonB-dependent receptor [Pseudomonas syringae pv. actinidiae]
MKTALSTTFGLLLLSAAVMTQAADMKVVKPMRGTVDSVQADTLNFTTRAGEHQSIQLTDKTGIRLVSKADLESIKADSFVGSAAIPQADGTLKALEVTVFEASLKGSGEGHYGWENADGSTGKIPGYMLFSTRANYDFGPQLSDLNVAVGMKNIFNRQYYTRSFDDNNRGKYVGEPRTVYVQTSVAF